MFWLIKIILKRQVISVLCFGLVSVACSTYRLKSSLQMLYAPCIEISNVIIGPVFCPLGTANVEVHFYTVAKHKPVWHRRPVLCALKFDVAGENPSVVF